MTVKLPGLLSELSVPVMRFAPPQRRQLLADLEVTRPSAQPRRRRLWDLSSNLHCSIIGTCLTTGELRQILAKIELPGVDKETDHELHGRAVLLAGKRDQAAKLLQKALDRRHRSTISQFDKARNADEVVACWEGAVQRAEIPGGYWAVLTHPETTEDFVRRVYGEVHMLSHLVGAANRADIRRLRELEAENAELREKVLRQQRQIRDTVVARDTEIGKLRDSLSKAAVAAAAESNEEQNSSVAALIADLRRRLDIETASREKIERRFRTVTAERDSEKASRASAERREDMLRKELEAAELSLAAITRKPEDGEPDEHAPDLNETTLLYVGGRTDQIVQLRTLAERWGATFLHHDGGIDNSNGLLASQVARADQVFFPVDCVSHNAVDIVKRVSRSAGIPFAALRSAGLTSFGAALRSLAEQRAADTSAKLR